MKIFLDTFDLINLLEKGSPCPIEDFQAVLTSVGATLVVCPRNLEELAAPLEMAGPHSSVMSTLNRLERLPLCFANEVKIPMLELDSTSRAFRAGRDVEPVDPFVSRMDEAVPLAGKNPTRHYLNYPLAEIAFDLWQSKPSTLRSSPRFGEALRGAVEARRSTSAVAGDRREFVQSIVEIARSHVPFGLDIEGVNLEELGSWLWDDPRRSPGISLWFKVRHQLFRNKSDRIKDFDVADLSWMWLLPYVQVATLDRRMKGYVERAVATGSIAQCAAVFGSLREVLDSLKQISAD